MDKTETERTAVHQVVSWVRSAVIAILWIVVVYITIAYVVTCSVERYEEAKEANSLEGRTKKAVKEYEEYILGKETPPDWRTGEWETFRAEHPWKARVYLRKKLEKRYSLEPYSLPQ